MFNTEFKALSFTWLLLSMIASLPANANNENNKLKIIKTWVLENQSSGNCQYIGNTSLQVRYISLGSPAKLQVMLIENGYMSATSEVPVAMGMHDAYLQFDAGSCTTEMEITITENLDESGE